MVLYRAYRRKSDGQWVNALNTYAGESFRIPAERHVKDIAKGLGVRPSEIEAVDGDSDPRTGTLIEFPPKVRVQSRGDELLAKGRGNWTEDEQKELLEIIARG